MQKGYEVRERVGAACAKRPCCPLRAGGRGQGSEWVLTTLWWLAKDPVSRNGSVFQDYVIGRLGKDEANVVARSLAWEPRFCGCLE